MNTTTNPTENQLARTVSEWSQIAGEQVRVESSGAFIRAVGSELGMLRLYVAFGSASNDRARIYDPRSNKALEGRWCFSLERRS